jgi:hypothetical protein
VLESLALSSQIVGYLLRTPSQQNQLEKLLNCLSMISILAIFTTKIMFAKYTIRLLLPNRNCTMKVVILNAKVSMVV